MNPWIAGLIGAAIMYVIAVIITTIDEYWVDEKFVAPLDALLLVILFIPMCVWGLFRHVVTPIKKDRQQDSFVKNVIADSVKITPSLYFHHDKKAKRLCNKFFFFRLEK